MARPLLHEHRRCVPLTCQPTVTRPRVTDLLATLGLRQADPRLTLLRSRSLET
jgi:hypothetical protein